MEDARDRQCGHKIMYLDGQEAERAAKLMHKRHKAPFVVYACPWCDAYHIGRNRSQELARRRTERKAAR